MSNILQMMNDTLIPISEMERNGWYFDLPLMKEIEKEETEKYEEMETNLHTALKEEGFDNFNLRSNKQKYEFIYSRKLKPKFANTWKNFAKGYNDFEEGSEAQFHLHVNTCFDRVDYGLHFDPVVNSISDTGLSVGMDTLRELREVSSDHPRIDLFNQFFNVGRQSSFLSRYIEGTIKHLKFHDGKPYLHTNYNQALVVTLRLSSSSPNMQNWPREEKFGIRNCLVSRFNGEPLVRGDMSQIEVRAAGWHYNDTALRLDYEHGIDIHGVNAARVFGDDFTKEDRTNTKQVTFLTLYRGSAWSVVHRRSDIPISDVGVAQSIIDAIYDRYPDLRTGQDRDLDFVRAHGYLEAPTGLRWDFDTSHYSLKNKVANYPIQHIAACLNFGALMSVSGELSKRRLRSLLVGNTHDEIAIDAYPGEREECEEILRWALTDGAKKWFNKWFGLDFNFPLDMELKE